MKNKKQLELVDDDGVLHKVPYNKITRGTYPNIVEKEEKIVPIDVDVVLNEELVQENQELKRELKKMDEAQQYTKEMYKSQIELLKDIIKDSMNNSNY